MADIDAAVNLIAEFSETTFAILKHNNACGIASRKNLTDAWKAALAGDPVSAFGGILITNAVASLILGRLYDRFGMPVVIVAFFLSSLFAPLVFLGNFVAAIAGMVLWGIGFGAQDTLLKALVKDELKRRPDA